MTQETFLILDSIYRHGYDNGQWGLQEDIDDTCRYFGTDERHSIEGKFLYLYLDEGDYLTLWNLSRVKVKPYLLLDLYESTQKLHIFKLD